MIFVRDKSFYKSFFTMTLTISLQNIIVYAVNLADNIMIGGYSELSLSAVAVVNQIQYLLQMMAMGVTNGLVVIAAQYWGKRQLEPIKRVFAVAVSLGTTLAFILFGAALLFPNGLLTLLTNQNAVISEAKPYLFITCFAYLFFMFTQISLGLMRSIEKVRIGFFVSCVALVVNVALNYCLIYGKFGFPELGIRGAAIATLISRLVEFSVVVIYVFAVEKQLRVKISDLFKVRKDYIKDYIKTGFPLVLSCTSWGFAMSVQTSILGHLGSDSVLSANSIAATVYSVVSVVCYANGSAASVIIGKTVGEGRIDDVKKYSKTLQAIFIISGVTSGLLLFAVKGIFISYYNVSPETYKLALTFMTILCITLAGTAYEAPSLGGIVSGGGDTKFVFRNDLIFMWGIVLPLSLLSAFVFKWPAAVTFFLLKSDQITKCAVAAVKVNRYKWIRQVTRDSDEKSENAETYA